VTGNIPETSRRVTVGFDGKWAEKSGEFRPGLLLPHFLRNIADPTVSFAGLFDLGSFTVH
jgi:hypothetical protein